MAIQTLAGGPGVVRSAATLPTTPDGLMPGLLLFFARPSPLQTWAEFFGHEWRHVGITVQTKDGLRVVSYGPKQCFRVDDPAEIMGNYNRVGVAWAVHSSDELRELERFCRVHEHLERSDGPYVHSGVLFGPVHLTARRLAAGRLRRSLMAVVRSYCRVQRRRYRDRPAYGCSTFVWSALDAARSEMLRLPLSAHPDDEAAYATPSTDIDELYARWLCGPTEIWLAIAESDRRDLDLDPDEIVIDLRDSVQESANFASSGQTFDRQPEAIV